MSKKSLIVKDDWVKDLVGVDKVKKGTFRSLNGAADENIFIGRASKAGFYCFFKVWRDMPYDAILDYEQILYRVEVKGSSGNTFNLSRGTRSGRQIKRTVSRTRTLSRDDCDFAVCVDSNNGDCYIIPEDIVEVLDRVSISKSALAVYKEKWKLFMFDVNHLTKEQTRDGIRSLSAADLTALAAKLAISVPASPVPVPHTRLTLTDPKDIAVYTIWTELAKSL